MNEEMLVRAMKHEFPESEKDHDELAKKYISKIVQLPLSLPDTSHEETMKFLQEQLGEAFEESDLKVHEEDRIVETSHDNETQSGQSPEYVCLEIRSELPQMCQSFLSKLCRIFEPFYGLENCLLRGPEKKNEKNKKNKFKTLALNFQMILPKYTYEERKALVELSKEATGAQRLPREWKRFLIYHRVAWNILSQSEKVKEIAGWQMQLVVWVFCCWQWEKQINDIIENWKKLIPVNSFVEDGEVSLEFAHPSLRDIVENGYKEKWPCLAPNEKQEDVVEPEKEIWDSLRKTLDANRYDVCMKGILSFQKFRFHCEIRHLSPRTDNQSHS